MIRQRLLVVLLGGVLVNACTCATADGVLYACSAGNTCEAGFTCGSDVLCHPNGVSDGGATGGGTGGSATGGGTGGGATDGGTGGATGGGTGGATGGGTGGATGGGTGGGTGGSTGGGTGGGAGDSGTPDAGPADAGPVDAGLADAGPCRGYGDTCALPSNCCLPLCTSGACQITGGSCGIAVPVSLSTGDFTVVGDTSGKMNASGGVSCDPSTGGEIVYSFTTANARPFFAQVTTVGGPNGGVLYLVDQCQTSFNPATRACAASDAGSAAAVQAYLQAGTYFLVVDSRDGGGGPFTVQATTAFAGDSCATAIPIALADAGPGSSLVISGDTSTMTFTTTPSCVSGGGTNGRDMEYLVTVPRAGTLVFTLSAAWDAWLMVRAGPNCPPGNELACKDTAGSGNEVMTLTVPAATTYVLYLGGRVPSSSGPYRLQIDLQ